jgi:uncharacterized membrane protein YdjX (TVP38/TMEM64 family)
VSFGVSELLSVADLLAGLSADAHWIAASAVFLLTATLMAFGIPGVLIPLSVASGAFLGPAYAAAAVALGALLGSQVFFHLSRHALRDRARHRLGALIAKIEKNFGRYGFWYVVGLRVAGAPHFAITTACAVLPIRPSAFAAATLIGLLPVTLVAAAFGSSF